MEGVKLALWREEEPRSFAAVAGGRGEEVQSGQEVGWGPHQRAGPDKSPAGALGLRGCCSVQLGEGGPQNLAVWPLYPGSVKGLDHPN